MREPRAWLLCLLLLGLALRGAASRAHQRSMETRSECRDPSPAVPARHPRATPHLGHRPCQVAQLLFISPLPRVALSSTHWRGSLPHQGGLGPSRLCPPRHENGGREGSWSLVLG